MPTLAPLSADIAARSVPPQAATAWARLLQPRSVRAGLRPRSAAAVEMRERYAVRLARLRSATLSVTSATTGWTGRTGRGTGFSSRFAGGPVGPRANGDDGARISCGAHHATGRDGNAASQWASFPAIRTGRHPAERPAPEFPARALGLAAVQAPGARRVQGALIHPREDQPVVQPVGPAAPELHLVAHESVPAPEVGDGHVVGVATVRPLRGIPRVGLLEARASLDGLGLA